jgi:hypothetical protein
LEDGALPVVAEKGEVSSGEEERRYGRGGGGESLSLVRGLLAVGRHWSSSTKLRFLYLWLFYPSYKYVSRDDDSMEGFVKLDSSASKGARSGSILIAFCPPSCNSFSFKLQAMGTAEWTSCGTVQSR